MIDWLLDLIFVRLLLLLLLLIDKLVIHTSNWKVGEKKSSSSRSDSSKLLSYQVI